MSGNSIIYKFWMSNNNNLACNSIKLLSVSNYSSVLQEVFLSKWKTWICQSFDLEKLERHLKSLSELNIPAQANNYASNLIKCLKQLAPTTLQMISEVVKLLMLVLCIHVSWLIPNDYFQVYAV